MSDIGDMGLTLHLMVLVAGFPVLVAGLAAWRVWRGRGPARTMALAALVFAVLPLALLFTDSPTGSPGDLYMALLEEAMDRVGWLAYALPMSVPLLLSGQLRGRAAARWVDAVHLAALGGLVALWGMGI
jgi:hypothetical protein